MLFNLYFISLMILISQTEEVEEINCRIFKKFGTYNYVCPPNSKQRIELEIKPSAYIKIICYEMNVFDDSHLPNLKNFGDTFQEFILDNCPIPKNGFSNLIAKFNINYLFKLKFVWQSSNQSIIKKHLEGLELLKELILLGNHLKSLETRLFKHTPNLLTLNLNENKINKLQDDIFRDLNELLYLSMVENKISYISRNAFRGLLRLRELGLTNNKLRNIELGVFDELINLEHLFLSYNKLHILNLDSLAPLKNLQYVYLDGNELVNISRKYFENNKKLLLVRLAWNIDLVLEDAVFSQFSYLISVTLSESGIRNIPEDLFYSSKNLYDIDLQRNRIISLPERVFMNLEYLHLLYLNNNEIKTLHPNVFQYLKNLIALDLSYNLITAIDQNSLDNLKKLQKIKLSHNRLKTIEPEIFSNMKNLAILLMNNNDLDFIENSLDALGKCRNIKLINLANNSISEFPYKLMKELVQNVNYEYFDENVVLSQSIDSDIIKIFLANNSISNVRFDSLTQENVSYNNILEVDISYNPIYCDCKSSDLVAHTHHSLQPENIIFKYDSLSCVGPIAVENVSLDELNGDELFCTLEKNCTILGECDCSYYSAYGTFVVDCSRRNLTVIPKLLVSDVVKYYDFIKLKHIDVHLEDNLLLEGPTELKNYFNITKLFLQRNKISNVRWVPQSIEVLNLENNVLISLDDSLLTMLNKSNMKQLHLGNNPWKCDCSTNQLHTFLRDHISQIYNATSILCVSTESALINMDESLLCPAKKGYILIMSSIILFCLIATITIVLVYLIYEQEIFIWLYSKDTCLWLIEEERIDKSKKYDAFVSFAHQDEDFVMEELVAVLENGETPYKLCVHIRDWIPGEYITKQIAQSVKDSRRTVIILSSDFLRSMWGRMEFRTAHTAAMEEGRVRVIVIIYGDLDLTLVNDDLKSYMKTNTYIEWGDPWFWKKLRYALPRTRRRYKKPKRRRRRNSTEHDIELQYASPGRG